MSEDPQHFNPFPGLRHFEFDETALFFGRDGQSDEVLRRLRMHRFLAVIGTSGSGKSSLIRAGVLPALYGGMMVQAGSRWRHAIFRPGDDPIGNLACALSKAGVLGADRGSAEKTGADNSSPEKAASEIKADDALDTVLIESTLRASGLGLIDVTRLAHLPPRENLLVIVDQFEELFRFANAAQSMRREDDAAAFVKLLLAATSQTAVPIYIIITMRSDFIGDCARFRDLAEAVNDGMYLIPRMTRDQRKEAISGPVAVGGAQIAPRLVNRILNEVGDSPDQLPIMQHALMRTWNCWEHDHAADEPLDLRHYEAIGAMAEALSRHAEEAYAELPGDRYREIAKRLFQSLTEKGGDNREVRRPTRIAEIMERTHSELADVLLTVECFRQPGRSFLMPPSDIPLTEHSIVDISHESLIRGWQRLCEWVQEESTSAETYRRLAETAAYYAHDQAGLLTNPELSVALAWRQREQPSSAWARRYRGDFDQAMRFLETSALAHEAEAVEKERRRVHELRRLQVFATVVLLAFVAAAALGAIAFHLRGKARSETAEAYRQKQEADLQKQEADKQRKEADRQKQEAERQKQAADAAKDRAVASALVADRQKAVAETEKRQAELSASVLHGEVLASRKSLVNDQQAIASLSDYLVGQSSKLYSIYALRQKQLGLSETGNHRASIEALNKILEIQPDDLPALSNRGYEYSLIDKPQESIADLTRYVAEDPRSSNAYQNLAIDHAMLKNYAAARQCTLQAIDTYSPVIDEGLFESEVSPDIQRATGHTLLQEPSSAYVVALHYELAAIDAMSGDARYAEDLRKADQKAAEYPRSPNAYLAVLNWAWLQSRRSQDYGISAFAGAMWEKLAENDARFHPWAVKQYSQFENDDARTHDPRYRDLARWVNVRCPGCNHKANLAESTPADVGMLQAQATELQSRIGYSSRDLMQLASVKRILDQAIEATRHSAQPSLYRDSLVQLLSARASVENDVNDLHALRQDCDELLALDPRNPNAEYYLAIYATDDAVKRRHFEAALADSPMDTTILQDYSRFLSRQSDEASQQLALRLMERRVRLSPFSTTAHFDLAGLQHQLHHDGQSLESIQNLLAISPESSFYYEQRRTIEASMEDRKQAADLHLAAGYLTAGNALQFLDRQDEALAQYIQALNAAAALPHQDNEDVRFQMELAARTVSEFLVAHSSAQEAARFWQNTAASTSNPTLVQWAKREEERLKPHPASASSGVH